MPDNLSRVTSAIRDHFFACPWNEVLDFIEFTIKRAPSTVTSELRERLNGILERENSAYRILGDQICPITSKEELSELDETLRSPVVAARQHLSTAVTLLSDRKKPDYRNAIKEAISAVEATCRVVTNNPKATLGSTLTGLQERVGMHSALKTALSNLYGFTSDENGIRHAMLDARSLTFSDAKFMLVACSAFVNFVVEKAAEAGVPVSGLGSQ